MILVILIILEASVAAAFALGLALRATGRGSVGAVRARNAAQAGLARSVSRPLPEGFDTATAPLDWDAGLLPGGGSFTVTVGPFGPRALIVSSSGRDRETSATATLAHLVRRRPRVPEFGAALVHVGDLEVTGSLDVAGDDRTPPGWQVCGAADSVSRSGRLALDTSATPLAGLPLSAWRRHAVAAPLPLAGAVVPSPLVLGNRCAADALNWGDPTSPLAPCGSHMPVIDHRGNLHIAGGMGHGLLIVDGDVFVGGGFRYHGVILVSGRLAVGPLGASVVGVVVAAGAGGHVVRGPLRVHFSKCLIDLALPATERGELVAPHHWLQRFDGT